MSNNTAFLLPPNKPSSGSNASDITAGVDEIVSCLQQLKQLAEQPIGVELTSTKIGCIKDVDANVIASVLYCIEKSEDGSNTVFVKKAVYNDGRPSDESYTGPYEECQLENISTECRSVCVEIDGAKYRAVGVFEIGRNETKRLRVEASNGELLSSAEFVESVSCTRATPLLNSRKEANL